VRHMHVAGPERGRATVQGLAVGLTGQLTLAPSDTAHTKLPAVNGSAFASGRPKAPGWSFADGLTGMLQSVKADPSATQAVPLGEVTVTRNACAIASEAIPSACFRCVAKCRAALLAESGAIPAALRRTSALAGEERIRTSCFPCSECREARRCEASFVKA